MHEINLKEIDLNLLVTLDVLLRERHVTRAASALGRSQPAVSHALARLRAIFGDPLLTPGRPLMLLTPQAERLIDPLARAMEQIEHVFLQEDAFDPKTTTRTWRIACPDALVGLLPELLAAVREDAPSAWIDMTPWHGKGLNEALEQGVVDMALTHARRPRGPGARTHALGELEWVTLAREGHPLATRCSVKAWAQTPHVVVATDHGGTSIVARALEKEGLEREEGASVPSFLMALHVVATTDMIFTSPDLFRGIGERLGLIVVAPPVSLPAMRAIAVWHERWEADGAHAWFRERLTRALEDLIERAR